MSLNFNSVGQSLGNNMKANEADFESFMQNMDSSDPSQMIEMQRKMQEWTLSVQMQTSTIKALGDVVMRTEEPEHSRLRVIAVVRSRNIDTLDLQLKQVAANKDAPTSLRLAALGALAPRLKIVAPKIIRYLLDLTIAVLVNSVAYLSDAWMDFGILIIAIIAGPGKAFRMGAR